MKRKIWLGIGAWVMASSAVSLCFAASPASESVPEGVAVRPSYQLRLGPFVTPPARTSGLLIKARINGGPPLRLLLDSGTQYLVLDRKSAIRSGCVGGTDLDLVGAGARTAKVVKQLRASTVQIGDFTLRDTPLLVTDQPLADGVQGAMALSLFAGYIVRLDIPGKTLDLLPYPSGDAEAAGAVRAVSSNHLLFVKGTYNDTHEGFFLIDTGATYNAISRQTARELNVPDGFAARLPLRGGTAEVDAPLLRGVMRLRVGDREIATESVVSIDLSAASRYHNLEVAGLIGYPALADSVLTVNYRDGIVRLNRK